MKRRLLALFAAAAFVISAAGGVHAVTSEPAKATNVGGDWQWCGC